ncbi:twin-arginine translocase TatA/TatE family subunit [Pontibacter sp. Tf4]|uniref:Sec-independent protein translocase subunit TatA/TatB n=1 Tax=Pontibacter sp. Tf4 TaxID=2761620 RepID=UPI0016246203|nr:twin-arginine translocase TatA/TatE family subunit [Pontibacter sp. Tf4]MBB6613081.1 twin-arginine translocase TatA/TatE family subunit [Pontibacter sp. Tf4]
MSINTVLCFWGGLGGTEVVLILLVVIIFFGAKRIPELARGLGKGIREFKDATKEIKNDVESSVKDEPQK